MEEQQARRAKGAMLTTAEEEERLQASFQDFTVISLACICSLHFLGAIALTALQRRRKLIFS